MPIAAVPSYLGQDFSDASPGLRFGLYLSIWTARKDQETEVLQRARARSREGERINELLGREGIENTIARLLNEDFCNRERLRPLPRIFTKNNFAAKDAWKKTCQLKDHDKAMRALLTRQRAAFAARAGAEDGLSIEARAIAPFTTGLGNEHPLENGFAFLNPHGLPYLAGSGVKGVIRRAAQDLAKGMWGETKGWSDEPRYRLEIDSGKEKRTIALSMLDVLFGREPASGDSDHVRGALTFWDVIPQIAGDHLMVEIMTPHQSHYYQQNRDRRSGDSTTPHDSGQPTPISFLTVPPGSTFVFHVVCDKTRLEQKDFAPDLAQRDDDGRPHWQTLIEEAFKHAFEWLGFGAKTAVGYGAMKPLTPTASATEHGAAQPVPSQVEASSSATETIWTEAKLTFNPGSGEIKAHCQGKTTAGLKGEAAQKLLEALGERAAKLKKAKELKNVPVRVRQEGNLIVLIGGEADPQ